MPIKLKTADPVATARDVLLLAGFDVVEERAIDHGSQFKLESGNVNVFSSGAVVAQGKHAAAVTRAFEAAMASRLEQHAKPRVAPVAAARPQQPTVTAAAIPSGETGEEVSFARRHPQWSDAPWDGVECPFDPDPPR